MGQAKRRGTLEERIKEGIDKANQRAEAAHQRYLERERNMTPDERKKRNEARQLITLAAGLSASLNL